MTHSPSVGPSWCLACGQGTLCPSGGDSEDPKIVGEIGEGVCISELGSGWLGGSGLVGGGRKQMSSRDDETCHSLCDFW